MYLRIDPNGRKYFIFRFFENKKERQLAGRPIKDIKTPEILYICREIEKSVF